MFRAILLAHIALGFIGLVVGPVLMFSRKTAGLHTKLGEFYHWLMLGICASAAALALLDWEHLWGFLWIGLGSYAFAFLGYISAKLRWRKWLVLHLIGQGGSYIAIITAVAVTNWKYVFPWTGLSEPWAWALPNIVGIPIIVWITREVVLGRRPRI
jgi:hypothetical protein